MIQSDIAKRLNEQLEIKNVTYKQLSNYTGAQIRRSLDIKPMYLKRICEYLNISVGYLITGKNSAMEMTENDKFIMMCINSYCNQT